MLSLTVTKPDTEPQSASDPNIHQDLTNLAPNAGTNICSQHHSLPTLFATTIARDQHLSIQLISLPQRANHDPHDRQPITQLTSHDPHDRQPITLEMPFKKVLALLRSTAAHAAAELPAGHYERVIDRRGALPVVSLHVVRQSHVHKKEHLVCPGQRSSRVHKKEHLVCPGTKIERGAWRSLR